MKISVVTISYNQAKYLPQCIESVLGQKGVDLEYILIDPGSTDGSRDIIETYRSRLAAVVLEPDQGPADGLNKGFARATGDIFYYLNSDDMVLPDAFQQAAKVFSNSAHIHVVYGDGIIIDAEGRQTAITYSSPMFFSAYQLLCGGASLMQPATFIRATAFRRTPGFNIANRTCWDGELLLDLAGSGAAFRHAAELWGAFRIYPSSITGSGRLQDIYREQQKLLFRRHMRRDRSLSDALAGRAFWCVGKMSAAARAIKYRKISDRLRSAG